MGDYWSLTECYGKKKDKKGKKDKDKRKKNKDSDKFLFSYEKGENKKSKSNKSVKYGEFLKRRDLEGIFEAVISVGKKEKKVYIYKTKEMRYPEVFMSLSRLTFKDWVSDQIDDSSINPNKIMYDADVSEIQIPKSLFNMLKDANVICVAYARDNDLVDDPSEDKSLKANYGDEKFEKDNVEKIAEKYSE